MLGDGKVTVTRTRSIALRRFAVCLVAATTFAVLFAVVTTVRPAAADTGCGTADALLDSGSLMAAQTAFSSLVDSNPNSQCATAGYQAATHLLAAARFQENNQLSAASDEITAAIKVRPMTPLPSFLMSPGALASRTINALLGAGLFDPALAAYQTALAQDPSLNVPGLGPAARANHHLALARALEKRGLHSDAVTEVEKAAEEDAATVSAAKDVPSDSSWWQSDFVTRLWHVLLALAVGLLVLGVLLGLAAGLWRWLRGGGLQLTSANDPSGSEGTGPGFVLLLRTALQRLSDTAPGPTIDVVDSWADPVSVPTELTDSIGQTKVLAAITALWSQLLSFRDRTVASFVHSDSARGPGISLSAVKRTSGKLQDDTTVWCDDFPMPDVPPRVPPAGGDKPALQLEVYPLAMQAAIWTAWATRRKQFRRLGTDDWKSYAFFATGAAWQAAGEFAQAKKMYYRALAADPDNLPAQLNLAIGEIRGFM